MPVRSRRLRSTHLKRLLAAAFGIVLAVGAGTATARFMWCAGMQTARISCCCPVERDAMRAPCCEQQQTFTQDGVQASESNPRILAAAPAPIVALLEALEDEPAARPRAEHSLHARAGPSERLHAVNSIYLL